ncbi:MAG TPA: hypothetical protein VEV84_03390 [Pyrinomonadaceae bacterium]|jgi:hypothetical protein|nr:hypothetical protein [Pyrinomonadaceae bacterium]
MNSNNRRNLILSAGLSIFALLTVVSISTAQSPSASPAGSTSSSGQANGNYIIKSSVELGVRGLTVNGDVDKYRSDLNYRAGFRMFDSSFFVQDKSSAVKPFDSALVQSSGWFSDPQGSFRLNMEKAGIYRFDSNVRRVRYFNNLNNHVVNWSQTTPTGSEHATNTLHHFGDFDLTIFPERESFRMQLGYSFNNTEGPGFATLRFPSSSSDEFQVNSDNKYKSQDFRAGVQGELLGFNLGLNYGHRIFNNNTKYFVDSLNLGNNPASTTASINFLTRLMPTKGTTDFGTFYVQRTFAKVFDFTGRFIYSESRSDTTQSDIANGRASATGNIIVLDAITAPGKAKRPQARSDIGLTWRPTDRFSVSNTFTFDQFNITGSNSFTEAQTTTTSSGKPNSPAATTTSGYRLTAYRRFSNLIEGDYQVNRMFAFNIGYRYTHRRVAADEIDINATHVATVGSDLFTNTTHSFIAGTKIKPYKFWSIHADVERGTADNVFTRLSNNKVFNFRLRTIANLKQFTLNLSAIVKNNDNPGMTEPVTGVPSTATIANTRTRIFSGSVDWTLRTDLTLASGYTYNQQTSLVDVVVPVGAPDFPTSAYRLGLSAYYMRDSYFFFDVTARPIKRVSLYASYRLDYDPGQGDRLLTRAQDVLTSYPIRFHMPEVRMSIRLTNNIDWNLGYQYYSYREIQFINPFATRTATTPATLVPQGIAPQNYTAHMPYTSLRIYFGRKTQDR